jgi:hypothetical protein
MAINNDILTKETLIDYSDVSYRGYSFIDAWPFQLNKVSAIQNAIKMCLMSQAGDYGRDVLFGGPLFPLIGKAILSEQEIIDLITKALEAYSNVVVVEIQAKFDDPTKTWKINIRFRDTLNKIETSVDIGLQG